MRSKKCRAIALMALSGHETLIAMVDRQVNGTASKIVSPVVEPTYLLATSIPPISDHTNMSGQDDTRVAFMIVNCHTGSVDRSTKTTTMTSGRGSIGAGVQVYGLT